MMTTPNTVIYVKNRPSEYKQCIAL